MGFSDFGPTIKVHITYRNGNKETLEMPQFFATAMALQPAEDIYSLRIDFDGSLDNFVQSHVPFGITDYYGVTAKINSYLDPSEH